MVGRTRLEPLDVRKSTLSYRIIQTCECLAVARKRQDRKILHSCNKHLVFSDGTTHVCVTWYERNS